MKPYAIKEHWVQDETLWVAIRARDAEWSWLTPEEAAEIGRFWVAKYGHLTPESDLPRVGRELVSA